VRVFLCKIRFNDLVMFKEFSTRTRQSEIEQLKKNREIFDLLVIGGGITGAAVAREASTRGLRCLLVEKGDFASGTSSRSSKLVHGGVRYLEQYEFSLVMESTRERARLWKLAPQLVKPLPFIFPAYKTSRVPLWKLNLGLWLYDLLALFRTPTMHHMYLRNKCLREEPHMRSEGLSGGIFYWDAATDDSLITLANIIDARSEGCTALSRVSYVKAELNSSNGEKPHTITLKDEVTGEEFQSYCRTIVTAGGPWTDTLLAQTGLSFPKLMLTTRGSHIVVPAQKLPAKHALVMIHPKDERVLFSIPWGEFTVVGTTDLFDAGAPEKVVINKEEVRYLIDSAAYYYPEHPLTEEDVVSTWSGLRPLIAPPENADASEISREHHLEWRDQGLVVIAGGKLTTHREMAEQSIDLLLFKTAAWNKPFGRVARKSRTGNRPFPQLVHPLPAEKSAQHPRLGKSEATAFSLEHLSEICRTQMVMSLEDLFVRRTEIFYKEPHNGWLLLDSLKETICKALNWNESDWKKAVSDYRDYIDYNVLQPLGRKLPSAESVQQT
jgi:glycerol-3-phosphate dehydrogenase